MIDKMCSLIKINNKSSNLFKCEFELNDSFKYSIEATKTTEIIMISLNTINPLVIEDLNWHRPIIKFEYIDWTDMIAKVILFYMNENYSNY